MNYKVPGRTIYTTEHRQPKMTTIRTKLNLQQAKPVYRNAQPKINKPIYKKDIQRKTKDVEHKVPYYEQVGVRVPITHEVPVYRDIPVPILIPEYESEEEDAFINSRTINVGGGRYGGYGGYGGYDKGGRYNKSSSSSSSEECSECYRKKHQKRYD